jgi:hypothetical protein
MGSSTASGTGGYGAERAPPPITCSTGIVWSLCGFSGSLCATTTTTELAGVGTKVVALAAPHGAVAGLLPVVPLAVATRRLRVAGAGLLITTRTWKYIIPLLLLGVAGCADNGHARECECESECV